MKKLITFLLIVISAHSFSQVGSKISITVTGTRNSELLVDERSYNLSTGSTSGNSSAPIILTDLQPGQHTIQLVRTSRDNTRKSTDPATFNSRDGYDMAITVNKDGSLQLKETRIKYKNNSYAHGAMSDANYSILIRDVQRQWLPGAKMTAVSNAFSNPNNYFTSAQALQLIETVKDEGNRVLLAKSAYPHIVDPSNFNQVYTLLENQPSKDDLASYISNFNNAGSSRPNSHNTIAAMPDNSFNDLLQSIDRQWLPGGKMTSATNAFTNTNNFFTTSQARQLITTVNDESNRLQLAKLSYRSIVDPNNFPDLYNLFSNQANRDNLEQYVETYKANNQRDYHDNDNKGYNDSGKRAMNEANFTSLLQDVQKQWIPGSKMKVVSNAFSNSNNFFYADQVKQLIVQIADEGNRLQLAKSSYKTIVDPANFNQIYDLLSSSQDKNDLETFVNSYNATSGYSKKNNGYNNGDHYGTAMPDEQFTVLSENIRRQWQPGARITLETNTFANTNNYFTTYQVRQLLQYILDENNRLTLAKASYRSVVDPGNFSQLYDLFSLSSSRDALASYVDSYRR